MSFLAALLLLAPLPSAAAEAGGPAQLIIDQLSSLSPARIERSFEVGPFGVEHQVRLALEARIDWRTLAGSNPWIRVAVNDNFLGSADLLNKRDEFRLRSGVDITWYRMGRWRVLYSPDFEQAIRQTTNPNACPDADPYRFVWNISPYVRPGVNRLRIENLQVLAKPTTLVLRNVKIEIGRPIAPPPAAAIAPAPTGPLPRFVAQGPRGAAMQVALGPGGTIRLAVSGQEITVRSRMSLPEGKWYTCDERPSRGPLQRSGDCHWATANCSVQRKVTVHPDRLDVADTLTNLTDRLIGVVVEHTAVGTAPLRDVRLGGRPAVGDTGSVSEASHPSAVGRFGDLGLGLVAVDDVFRVHHRAFRAPEALGLADPQLGLDAGKSITLEWSVYAVPGGDYWGVVNAIRRAWDVNFTIPGPFVFAMHFREPHPAAWYADWLRARDLKIVAGGIAKYPDGRYAHGTGILHAPQWIAHEAAWTRKMLAAAPGTQVLSYFHAQCSTEPGGEEKYADSRLLTAQGEHLGYPYAYRLPLYLPTRDNAYGKALWGYVHACLDQVGSTGLYWDEMSHSVVEYAYGAPWDGATVTIHPQTHAVTGKRSSVALLMQPLELDIVRYLRREGKFLLANTQATTRTMTREKVLRFVETGGYYAVNGTHLGCPLGLGNHHLEQTQADSARAAREILAQSGIYYGWQYARDPAPWNFTSVMYPITPEELYDGVVLGKERILTSRSGRFGWPDGSAAEVYVIDGEGRRSAQPLVKEKVLDGRREYEIRMPGDHFAILVKRANQ